jgi:hypothetical protein
VKLIFSCRKLNLRSLLPKCVYVCTYVCLCVLLQPSPRKPNIKAAQDSWEKAKRAHALNAEKQAKMETERLAKLEAEKQMKYDLMQKAKFEAFMKVTFGRTCSAPALLHCIVFCCVPLLMSSSVYCSSVRWCYHIDFLSNRHPIAMISIALYRAYCIISPTPYRYDLNSTLQSISYLHYSHTTFRLSSYTTSCKQRRRQKRMKLGVVPDSAPTAQDPLTVSYEPAYAAAS